jgi:DNA recombination protein RmuC
MQILIFVAGCVLGAVAILIVVRGQLADLRKAASEARDRENQANAKAAASAAEVTAALVEKAGALKEVEAANRRADEMIGQEREAQQKILGAKDEQIEKLNEFIAQAKEAMTKEFQAVSGGVLKDAREQLTQATDELIKKHGEKTTVDVELHRQEIETMLKPVEATMKRLDEQVATSNVARSNAEALLDEQIKRLAGASESLSSALRKPVIRGSWGEMTLENALENAGLRAEIDFVLQHSTDGEDGRKRTDAIINLPKGRKLIIDSKNLMESYIAYSIAQDPAQKAVLQAAHAKSLKNHIRDLSSKEYQDRYDTPDCVILFIPHDGMYHAALQDEAELIREACEKRVFVTNPMSLIPLLKAVGYVLNQERANKSAEAIKSVGEELYAQIARFAANMANIGVRLEASVKAYNDAIPGLDRFIVSKARTLKRLGAGKGSEPELPEPVELEPRLFSSPELRTSNLFLPQEEDESELSLAASAEGVLEDK